MLTENYKKALLALKDQASAVTSSLYGEGNKTTNKERLCDAQQRMAEVDAEASHIVRLIMKNNITVPTLTEEQLSQLLVEGTAAQVMDCL